jgi:hypothetical protein
MRVRAKARGWDGLAIREEGDEFDMPDSTNLEPETDWFVVVKKAAPQDSKGKGPDKGRDFE